MYDEATASVSDVALVTGGGRGLGAIFALRLAEEGLAVAITGRDPATLDASAERLRALGVPVVAAPADVSDPAAVADLVERVTAELGPVDLLVNNAGITDYGPLWEADPDAWWRVLEVNLRGPFLCSRAVLPAMIERGRGRIVNVTSRAGNAANPAQPAYAASKAALTRLTDSLAAQVEPHGITVFAITPGLVRTELGEEVAARRGNVAESDWVPAEAVATLLARIARGDLDGLSGRFLRSVDDLDAFVAREQEIRDEDLLTLGLREA